MAGMYIHIPFCRKICSYCDFYKTTLSDLIPDYLHVLETELDKKKDYLAGEPLESIYLGGGTPSLIQAGGLAQLFESIIHKYAISDPCEVTLEANPDDLTQAYLRELRAYTPVNRLSIGIQSFNDNDLLVLNRRHNALQALTCVQDARIAGFDNITIDLIYGLPGMKSSSWERNLETAFSLDIQHLSAYHLTIEPNTALSRRAARGLISLPAEDESSLQFMLLNKIAGEKGFEHYEISNLSRNGFMSRHNSNYWFQKKYLGLGPSAHSYNLDSRQWNIRNVRKYMDAVLNGISYTESEFLDIKTRFHEYLMLSLRTIWGISITEIREKFGETYLAALEKNIKPFLSTEWVLHKNSIIKLTPAGWMVSDYILGRLMAD